MLDAIAKLIFVGSQISSQVDQKMQPAGVKVIASFVTIDPELFLSDVGHTSELRDAGFLRLPYRTYFLPNILLDLSKASFDRFFNLDTY